MVEEGSGGPRWQGFAKEVAEAAFGSQAVGCVLRVRAGTAERAQGLLPSNITSPMRKRNYARLVFAVELVFQEAGKCPLALAAFADALCVRRPSRLALHYRFTGWCESAGARCRTVLPMETTHIPVASDSSGNNWRTVAMSSSGNPPASGAQDMPASKINAEPTRSVFRVTGEGKRSRRER